MSGTSKKTPPWDPSVVWESLRLELESSVYPGPWYNLKTSSKETDIKIRAAVKTLTMSLAEGHLCGRLVALMEIGQ